MSRASYAIPPRVRRGALKIVAGWSVQPRHLVDDLGTRIGFHTVQELLDAEFGDDGHLVPVGSATASELAIQPALDVLEDERFADARSHLIEAQKRLRESDPDEAVDEARMAVEHGMLAVIDATGTPRPARRQANELFDALTNRDDAQPAFANRHAEELILAVPRFRGRTSAGHAGSPAIELGEAEAVVAAAAASLLFLATKLL